MMRLSSKTQFVVQNGKPQAVILDIHSFEKLLELAEDVEDLRELRKLSRKKQDFIPLETYLAKRH